MSGIFSKLTGGLKSRLMDSAKGIVLTSAERESSDLKNIQSARVASVIREIDEPLSSQTFQSAERVISVGSFTSDSSIGDDAQALADINAALGSDTSSAGGEYLDLSRGIGQRELAALFEDESDEDYENGESRYGLLRHLWDRNSDSSNASEDSADEMPSNSGAAPIAAVIVAAQPVVIEEDDPDDLSGPGVIEALAEAAAAPGSVVEQFLVPDEQVEAERHVAAFNGEAPVGVTAEAASQGAPLVALADRQASSKAIRIIAVFKRLKAEGRLASDFAARLLPLIDGTLEPALLATEEGREVLDARSGFLSQIAFDEPVEDLDKEGDQSGGIVGEAPSSTEPMVLEQAASAIEAAADEPSHVSIEAPIEFEEPTLTGEGEVDAPDIVFAAAASSVTVDEAGPEEPFAAAAPPVDAVVGSGSDIENSVEPDEVTAQPNMTEAPVAMGTDDLNVENAIRARRVADEQGISLLKEWLAAEPVQEFELNRLLDERGRERPDEQEVDYTLRRLKEYLPSPSSRRNAIRQLSSVLSKDDEIFSIEEVCLLKAIIGNASDDSRARWGFQSNGDASRKLVFLVHHDFVAAKVGEIEQRLKDGFSNIEDVKAYRVFSPFVEELQLAFPQMGQMAQDFLAQLDKAEFDFALAGGQEAQPLIESGLIEGAGRQSPGASVNLGASRLLASRMPAAAQEALSRFMSIGKLIEPIDLMIIDEGVRSGEAPEKHPMHPMLMELQYRALLEIRGLMEELKRRPLYQEQIPSIIRARHEELGVRYEAIVRNQDEIERSVQAHRKEAAQLGMLSEEVERLKVAVEERDQIIRDSEEASKRLPVMDALISMVRQVADRDERLSVVGKSYLRADLGADELAVAFIHGHNLQWQAFDGTKLRTDDGAIEVDVIGLCNAVRQSHGFSDEGGTRIRVVLVAGTFGTGRPNYLFTAEEVLQDPSKLFGASEIDALAARKLGF